MSEEQKFPRITTGAYIFNKEGKVFLMESPKFQNKLIVPGGHVEWGESVLDCLLREVKEETGLSVSNPEFIRYVEFINDPVYSVDKHFVSFNFKVYTADEENAVKLDGKEGVKYYWLSPEEVLQRSDVEDKTKLGLKVIKEESKVVNEDYKANYQRAIADYQNFKKEVEARRGEWVAMSELQILEEFIPVYDNFKKAFAHHPNTTGENEKQLKGWIDGIGYIMKQFAEVMKNHNVEEIKTVGEKLDTAKHESVGEEEVEGKSHGEIIREVDGGYVMSGRVIKVAKVIIAK